MYAKIIGLTLVLFMSAVAVIFAAEVEIAADGALRAAEEQKMWQKTGVTISEEAHPYGDAWQEAYKNPGTAVPVKMHREYKPRGLYEITVTTIADAAVIY